MFSEQLFLIAPLEGCLCIVQKEAGGKETKDTARVRLVFDASATNEESSLNECLYMSPQWIPLIFYIFLRFRTFFMATTPGIEKVFLQVSIGKGDRGFLWFDDIFSGAPRTVRNRFARVVFSVTRSPILVNGTIRKYKRNYNFDEEFVRKVLGFLCR